MIYYPLSVLMLAGISRGFDHYYARKIQAVFSSLLGDRKSRGGLRLQLTLQDSRRDVWRKQFLMVEDFIGNDKGALVLGDEHLFGHKFF